MEFVKNCFTILELQKLYNSLGVKFPYIFGIHLEHHNIVQDTFYIANFVKFYYLQNNQALKFLQPKVEMAIKKPYFIHTCACFNGLIAFSLKLERDRHCRIVDITKSAEKNDVAIRTNKYVPKTESEKEIEETAEILLELMNSYNIF